MYRRLTIAKIGTGQTVSFAADELARCIRCMDEELFLDGRTYDSRQQLQGYTLWVGLDGSVQAAPEDDEIRIDVREGNGIITGSNERSVLIAVYRFLFELGCRFIRPGREGELIPRQMVDPKAIHVQVAEKASYRHRAVCIEGADSYEHIYNMIDWLPKIGMSGYFVQFQVPCSFFERWYKHVNNPQIPEEPVSREDIVHIWKRLEEELKKRDLMYHAVGHGWTCEPFGIPGDDWRVETGEIAPQVKQYFAQVNGKRELWNGIALNTNLCYSNSFVRDTVTDAIVEYCKKNPSVDYVHFWLADDSNNQCECPECSRMRPSDFYVMMLNELDKKLTEAGISAKVVFLVYVDLLWAPEFHRLENPDRFVLMFAPITRTYTRAFTDLDASEAAETAPYVRNKLVMPKTVNENLAHLSDWKQQFSGDSFDFDYHLMWDHMLDPGYYECARILHKDMAGLDSIGLNGMVSCQVQRAFFPTALPMYAMARALWDKNSDFEEIAAEYFRAAFGEEGEAVRQYLKKLSELFLPPYQRMELPQEDQNAAKSFAGAKELAEEFRAQYIDGKAAESLNWKYLSYHAELCIILAQMLYHRAMGNQEESLAYGRRLEAYLSQIEPDTHKVLDVFNYKNVLNRFMR